MTLGELVVFSLRPEQRRHCVCKCVRVHGVFQLVYQLFIGCQAGIVVAQCGADGGKAVGVFRENGVFTVKLKGFNKALAQTLEKSKRTAEKDNLSCQLTTLGKAGYGLVNNSLEDGGRDILVPASLIENRLNVRLCKYSAS